MPPEEVAPQSGLPASIARLAAGVVALRPGPLAELRRMDVGGAGTSAFWRLMVENGLDGSEHWLQFLRLLALLTPRGEPGPHKHLHNPKRALGTALADSDYPEPRLLRFLALPLVARATALERMVRWLAANDSGPGIDCLELFLLLRSGKVQHSRKLAEHYYRAADRGAKAQEAQQ